MGSGVAVFVAVGRDVLVGLTVGGVVGSSVSEGASMVDGGVEVASVITGVSLAPIVAVWPITVGEGVVEGTAVAVLAATTVAVTTGST